MFTEIFWRFLVLEMFLMGVLCSKCPEEHLQKTYCNNEYVLEAKFLRLKNYKGPYRMLTEVSFKGHLDNKIVKLDTDAYLDSVHEDDYIIFGQNINGKIKSKWCKGLIPKNYLTSFQVKSVRDYYKLGCDCIQEIGDYYNTRYCKWKYGFMMRDKGRCVWVGWKKLSKCEIETIGEWHDYKKPPV